MNKQTRYRANLRLTGKESVKLQDLSAKLRLSKSEVVGLLIMEAQVVKDDAGAWKLVDKSLIIQEDQPDVN